MMSNISWKKYVEKCMEGFPIKNNIRWVDSKFKEKNSFEENLPLKSLNKIFTVYRGYTFKLPKENEPVILICSGGFDSVSLWGYLMEIYKLKIYPLHFYYHRSKQLESIKFFYKFYKKKYPSLCFPPFVIDNFEPIYKLFNLGPNAYKNENLLNKLIFNNAIINQEINSNYLRSLFIPIANPVRFLHFAALSYGYSLYLHYTKNIHINTILTGCVPEDGIIGRDSTLTTLRSINLTLCLLLGDFDLQFTSIALEMDNNFFITKKELALFCKKHNIPIENSWSCDMNNQFHCGKCYSCRGRKKIFKISNILDKTIYKKPFLFHDAVFYSKVFFFFRENIKRIIEKFKSFYFFKNLKEKKYIGIKKNITYKIIDKKVYIICKKDNEKTLVTLNQTASEIFRLLVQNDSLEINTILNILHRKYKIRRIKLQKDLETFLNNGLNKYLEWRDE